MGICTVELRLPGIRSLKAKRSVVKSITARVNREFNVSCAEVDYLDAWQTAGIGIAVVTNSAVHAQQALGKALHWIEANRPDVMIVDHQIEIIS